MRRKRSVLQSIRDLIEQKLQAMLASNPLRMDYYRKYQTASGRASHGCPSSEAETEVLADRVYDDVWQRSVTGPSLIAA